MELIIMIKILLKTSIFIYISIFPINSFSENSKKVVLRIGTMDLKPYGWQDREAKKYGIIYELNEEIAKRAKVSYVNTIYPFKRMLKLLNDGEIDLISSQAHAQSMESGDKLAVQFDIDVIAGTRKGSKITKLKDFKNKKVVYHRSASYKELEGLPSDIIRVNSYGQALGILVRNGHADGAVFSEPAYYYYMQELGFTPKDFGNVILITPNKKQWIFVRRGLPNDLKEKLKNIVQDIYKEDLYNKLLFKYGKK
jgi:ABC-type amino acid transport substrate-binding protein